LHAHSAEGYTQSIETQQTLGHTIKRSSLECFDKRNLSLYTQSRARAPLLRKERSLDPQLQAQRLAALLRGRRLHPLKGDMKGFWSVTVSGNWRIIFQFGGTDAVQVDYVDYH
jgi:proteic killer suppression protein